MILKSTSLLRRPFRPFKRRLRRVSINDQKKLLKNAKRRTQACFGNIKKLKARSLGQTTLIALADAAWLEQGLKVLIAGVTGVGKTYLTCALINGACPNAKTAFYLRSQRLL